MQHRQVSFDIIYGTRSFSYVTSTLKKYLMPDKYNKVIFYSNSRTKNEGFSEKLKDFFLDEDVYLCNIDVLTLVGTMTRRRRHNIFVSLFTVLKH